MKLFIKPGACSLSPHIISREAGLNLEVERVVDGKTASGVDFRSINPKGYVPTLQLDDGQVLTEGVVIVQYLADQKPEAKLAPKAGTLERYRLQEWLVYIATELHKGYSPLFRKGPEEALKTAKDALVAKLGFVNKHLEKHQFLLGDGFTAADAYLFTVTSWSKHVGIDLVPFPALSSFLERTAKRPAVHAAMLAEGLIKN